ncbi:40S ribosomal protein S27A (nucleomorph) [Guillardia theta]|uniref:40S ribosomal protein S27A n=1 Tax=Guillardia theta TaxID=55529 RepID=Q98S99_GUITH|nr:40S ribosomal protein S27A [Guillardia theta]AAK39684.1 40S ribosomal protein S27A [Guillardia theta]
MNTCNMLNDLQLKINIKFDKKIFGKIIELNDNKNLIENKFLRGGGKKRKKKNYTKPKKIKKRKNKVKLRVLSYYHLDQNKITRILKESPDSPGCFMANHFNRITCGKTGLTFLKT